MMTKTALVFLRVCLSILPCLCAAHTVYKTKYTYRQLYNPTAHSYLCYQETPEHTFILIEHQSPTGDCTWKVRTKYPRTRETPTNAFIVNRSLPAREQWVLTTKTEGSDYHHRLYLSHDHEAFDHSSNNTSYPQRPTAFWTINWIEEHQNIAIISATTNWEEPQDQRTFFLTYDPTIMAPDLAYVSGTTEEIIMGHLNPAYDLFILNEVKPSILR